MKKVKWRQRGPSLSVPQLRVSGTQGFDHPWSRTLRVCERDKVFKEREGVCRAARGCRFLLFYLFIYFFIFLDRVQIKMPDLPDDCLSAF